MDEIRKALNTLEIGHMEGKVSLQTIQEKREEYDLIKGGEGSRGGKVIGHTKSGKPIYDTHYHEKHKDFTAQEDEEAASINESLQKKHYDKYKQLKAASKEETSNRAALHHNKHLTYGENAYYHRKKADLKYRRQGVIKGGDGDIQKALQTLELAHMAGQIDRETIEKARTKAGVYAATSENKKLGRVGQKYKEGEKKDKEDSGKDTLHKFFLKEGQQVRVMGEKGPLQRVMEIKGNSVRLSGSGNNYVHVTKLQDKEGEPIVKERGIVKGATDYIIKENGKITIDTLDPDSPDKLFKEGDKIKFGDKTGIVGKEIEDGIHEVIVDKK